MESTSATHKPSVTQKIGAVATFFVGLFLAASVLSFHPADPPADALYPASTSLYNWCGSMGAYVAYAILSGIGDGAYPLLLFIVAGAFMWLSELSLEDKVFRIIGAALLVLDVTVASAMIAVEARLPEGNGGILGLSIWMYLEPRLGGFGTVLMLIPVALVGLVLLTDTWLVIIPVAIYKFLRDRAREPAKRLATAALATVGAAGEQVGAVAAAAGAAGGAAVAEADEDDKPRPVVRKQRKGAPEKPASHEEEDGADEEEGAAPKEDAAAPLPPRSIVIRDTRRAPEPKDEEDEDFAFTPLASTPWNQDYQLPPVDLLGDPEYADAPNNETHIREQAAVLTKTLGEFGIEASVVAIETGPVVTQYELALAPGIKVGKVIGLADDIAINLKAPNVRIVAPLPDKDTIGVEVQNSTRQIVRLKEIVLAAKDAPERMGLPLLDRKSVV